MFAQFRLARGEKNFHIFYQMYNLPEALKEKLELLPVEHFRYLNNSEVNNSRCFRRFLETAFSESVECARSLFVKRINVKVSAFLTFRVFRAPDKSW